MLVYDSVNYSILDSCLELSDHDSMAAVAIFNEKNQRKHENMKKMSFP